ncbi:MAG: electron transfer flavoprotein-ubiquinone oxidoreductase, partial [Shewanellaceae bacterium]|nr:electron transfer flavoprotein-ubiquinone oxidoreductase [Shewanellaceae bacterium]
KQLAHKQQQEISVCLIEKGAQIGAHLLSGAILETSALTSLFEDWQERAAPVTTPIKSDQFYWLSNQRRYLKIPKPFVPPSLKNNQKYLISLGQFCLWMGQQAEALGVEIFTGFAAQSLFFQEDKVAGVVIGDMGLNVSGKPKNNYVEGMIIESRYTLLAEGCRGHLGKDVIQRYQLDQNKTPQHYALGMKEVWRVPSDFYQAGQIMHTLGWPLQKKAHGGGFLYQGDHELITVGLIVDLNYENPYLSPFDEFQALKKHPLIAQVLRQGERIGYGAKALSKGGLHALPAMQFPGGLLIGCDAGTLNGAKLKGIHTAMESGLLAAKTIIESIRSRLPLHFDKYFQNSSLHKELKQARNFTAAIHQFGLWGGGCFNLLEQTLFRHKLPIQIKNNKADHFTLKSIRVCSPIHYEQPDGHLTFDKLSSIFLSNLDHDHNQPCHLKLKNPALPIQFNLTKYAEPAQRYCPAGVYEITMENNKPSLQIYAQNCLHCKTCDIKDPLQNIEWVTPEGGSGPNYINM